MGLRKKRKWKEYVRKAINENTCRTKGEIRIASIDDIFPEEEIEELQKEAEEYIKRNTR